MSQSQGKQYSVLNEDEGRPIAIARRVPADSLGCARYLTLLGT